MITILPLFSMFLLGFLIYWTPTFVAVARGTIAMPAIAALNLFFGWTVVGGLARSCGR